jgi:hypothetical protein
VLPIDIGGRSVGLTRDLSAGGVYFESDTEYAVGSEIRFALEFASPGGRLLLRCVGEVVRIARGERIGVAVRISESRLERIEETSLGSSAAGGGIR